MKSEEHSYLESLNDDKEEAFDTDWIVEQEQIQNIKTNYSRESMDQIQIVSVYINLQESIEKVLYEHVSLDKTETGSQIGKESMLKLIQTKKKYTPTSKYKLLDVLIYTVDLEPETIQSYSKMDIESIDKKELASLLKVLPIIDDIAIPDSIFIFHDINAIYMIFQEVALDASHRHTLKSILKKPQDETSVPIPLPKKIKKTKKVVLNEPTIKRITHKLNPSLA
jgi:hypothetical protein